MFKTWKVGGQRLFEQSSTKIAQLVPPGFQFLLAHNNIPLPQFKVWNIFSFLAPKQSPLKLPAAANSEFCISLQTVLKERRIHKKTQTSWRLRKSQRVALWIIWWRGWRGWTLIVFPPMNSSLFSSFSSSMTWKTQCWCAGWYLRAVAIPPIPTTPNYHPIQRP